MAALEVFRSFPRLTTKHTEMLLYQYHLQVPVGARMPCLTNRYHNCVGQSGRKKSEAVIIRIWDLLKCDGDDIFIPGRAKKRVPVRSLFCHIAVHGHSVPCVTLARRLGMSPSAISYAEREARR